MSGGRPAADVFALGDVVLQSGAVLANASIAYLTLGALNRQGNNAVVMPTYYTGMHWNYLPLIGSGRPLDPARYFIVIPNMFGNGLSTSPSTQPADSPPFPVVSVFDNVMQQGRLVFERLGVKELALVCGWSLGGMQAYQWAATFPDAVRRLLCFGSAASTSTYNRVFLAALAAVLRADACWDETRCMLPPSLGLRAFAGVYMGWAYAEPFFRRQLYRELGFDSIAALTRDWEEEHLRFHANDLMAMLQTWSGADLGANAVYCGNTATALRSIKARALIVACSSDRYFPPIDNAAEAALIPDCRLRLLESDFGHCALSPGRVPVAMNFIEECLRELLVA